MTAPAAAAAVPKPTPAPARRMTLTAISKGKQEKPQRVLVYGVEGVGKSTFAADAPDPIFVDAEDGTAHLSVQRFPRPGTWLEVLEAVRTLETEEHQFKTLVVDPLDRLEAMLWAWMCERDKKDSIEEYGYGKGYTAALGHWRSFLAALERLQEKRRMHIVLVAHCWVKGFKNPTGEDYDRYQLKLHDKAGGMLKEWSDHVLFAQFEAFAYKKSESDKMERAKGVSTGARVLFTTRTAAYDAKHRGRMPERLALSWLDFWAAAKASGPQDPAVLRVEIDQRAATLPEADKAKVVEALARAGDDADKLDKLNNWLTARIAELAAHPQ